MTKQNKFKYITVKKVPILDDFYFKIISRHKTFENALKACRPSQPWRYPAIIKEGCTKCGRATENDKFEIYR